MTSFSDNELFALFSSEERDRFEGMAKLQEFDDHEEVLSAEHPSHFLSIIVTGEVDLVVPGAQGPITVASLNEGDLFGELEPFEMPKGLQHIAIGDTITRSIEKNPLKHELLEHRNEATQLLFAYCRSISEKLRKVNEVAVGLAAQRHDKPIFMPVDSPERKAHLTQEEMAWLRMLGKPVEFHPHDVILREGDLTRDFYVVERGEVEVHKQADAGHSEIIARLGAGDLFGHMALIDHNPRSATIVATAFTRCIQIEPEALEHALHLNFTVAFKFLETMRHVMGRLFSNTVQLVAQLSS